MRTLVFFLLLSLPVMAQEQSEALSAMRLGCDKHGVGLGCFNYANMLMREEKPEEAEKYYEKGCKLKHEASCEKQKWDIPDREKATSTEIKPTEAIAEPEAAGPVDMDLDLAPDINQ